MNLTERLCDAAKLLGPWLSVCALALIACLGFSLVRYFLPATEDVTRGAAWVALFVSFASFGGHALTKRD